MAHDPLPTTQASENAPKRGLMRSDLAKALLATLFFGAASGIFMATLNNYLSEVHHLGAEARGWLEFPRELPGFLMMFVAGMLLVWFRESRMGGRG